MDIRTWGKYLRLFFLAICNEGTFVIPEPIFRHPFLSGLFFPSSILRTFTYRFLFIHQKLFVFLCKSS